MTTGSDGAGSPAPIAGPDDPGGGQGVAGMLSILILGFLALANFVDLIPAVADETGIWVGGYYYASWILYLTLPLTALTLIFGSVAIGLAKWAAPGRKLGGLVLYLLVATIVFATAKFGVFWIAHLRHGRAFTVPLWVVAALVGTTAIWATVREGGASRRGSPSLYLWGLFLSLFLTEVVLGVLR